VPRLRPLVPLVAAVALAAPAVAAADSYTYVKGVPGHGPAAYDRVGVLKIGPDSARHRLVLVPGFLAGAGDFRLVAHEIVRRVPNLQVWAVDRRSNLLEDQTGFRTGNPDTARGYYLFGAAVGGKRFAAVKDVDAGYARGWGLAVSLGDLRRVVLAARRGGHRVIIGGHSLGASTAGIYATWDFAGRPGYRDVEGIVLMDGGAGNAFGRRLTLAAVRKELAAIRDPRQSPFASLFKGFPSYLQGVFVGLSGLYAKTAPNAPSGLQPLLGAFPALKGFTPARRDGTPLPLTNLAQLGYAFDRDTSPKEVGLLHVNAGAITRTGSPRGWVDGGVTPIRNLAEVFSGQPDFAEWYFPRRLSLDVGAASTLGRNAVTRALGLRPWHWREVNVPLYAFQSNLTKGRVLKAARAYVKGSRIPRATFVGDGRQEHLDQFTAAPSRNRFLTTVVPFLRSLTRGR